MRKILVGIALFVGTPLIVSLMAVVDRKNSGIHFLIFCIVGVYIHVCMYFMADSAKENEWRWKKDRKKAKLERQKYKSYLREMREDGK